MYNMLLILDKNILFLSWYSFLLAQHIDGSSVPDLLLKLVE